ncbi:terminase small subunit [Moraxella nasovis]|uniref:terminase small subunit n=1 Tax=Moraxella nasovis TaxID=2904121 RepID=UPI001F6261F7|nr:terminase small subunit [Moraxella nasovis]UNU73273.1 terminase small subunit [Moraxella nasovis]UNU74118.1 terminase small subunit [Moraxella nasovis]
MAKLTPKQEQFCQKYIELGNASEAYRQSYNAKNMKDETVNRNAKALLDNNKITTRLNELRQAHANRHDVTIDEMLSAYDEAYQIAKLNENPTAMISAINAKVKVLGMDRQSKSEIRIKELEAQLKQLEIDRLKAQMIDTTGNEIQINVVRVKNE